MNSIISSNGYVQLSSELNMQAKIREIMQRKLLALDLRYSDDRVKEVCEILGVKEDFEVETNWINLYLQSEAHVRNQIKTKTSYRSEEDTFSKALSVLADYILECDYYNEQHEQHSQVACNNLSVHKLNPFISYDEILRNQKIEIVAESNILYRMDSQPIEKVRKKDEMAYRRRILEQEIINDDDLATYQMLNELNNDLIILKNRLGYGESALIRKEREVIIKQLCSYKNKKYDLANESLGNKHVFPPYYSENRYYNQLKKLYSEISSEMKLYKKLLNKPITFNHISKGSTVLNYDYSSFNMSSIEQVSVLLMNYMGLHDRHANEFNDVWALLHTLDELIVQSNLSELELLVIGKLKSDPSLESLKFSQFICKMTDFLNANIECTYSMRKVETLLLRTIPRKIVHTYLTQRDTYVMERYQVMGKSCSACGAIKLGCKRNYSRDKRNADGLKGICKACERKVKNTNTRI